MFRSQVPVFLNVVYLMFIFLWLPVLREVNPVLWILHQFFFLLFKVCLTWFLPLWLTYLFILNQRWLGLNISCWNFLDHHHLLDVLHILIDVVLILKVLGIRKMLFRTWLFKSNKVIFGFLRAIFFLLLHLVCDPWNVKRRSNAL